MSPCSAFCAVFALASSLAAAGEVSFTRKPTATRDGETVRIDFAVSRSTDVAVTIEDGAGNVVRHLVAGVLGANAPAPLKPNALTQSVVWDGKGDWGRPAPSGPFHVRVALGLGATYDKEIVADPMAIGGVLGMAGGPDGTLYLVTSAGAAVPNWSAQRLIALNRDGTFQRTLIPMPATATKTQITALGGVPVEVGGRTVPMVIHVNERRTTAFRMRGQAGQITVTPSGQLLVISAAEVIGLVDTTGASAGGAPSFLGPKPLPTVPTASFHTLCPWVEEKSYLASSGDGKYAYFSGIAKKPSPYGDKTKVIPPYSAVFRVKLPDRSPAEVFFGDLEATGADEKHLGGMPHGMAVDGKGHLLICDPANHRVVVVAEADGRLVGSFAAENPEFIGTDPKTGAVYLVKVGGKGTIAEVVKLDPWEAGKDPKPAAAVQLRTAAGEPHWWFAVDASARPSVLWVSNGSQLFRLEDLGKEFSEAKLIGNATIGGQIGDGGFVNLTVDHYRADPDVYVRVTHNNYAHWFTRYNEKTDKTEVIKDMNVYSAAAGSCLEVGPDGNLYVQAWPQYLFKFDRTGKPLKWDAPYVLPEGVKTDSTAVPPNAIFMPVVMVYMTHTLGIRPDGHLFAFEENGLGGFRKDECKALFEYDPSGKKVGGPIVWKTSDSIIGPRFDQQGNIYVAEQVRPADQLIPPEFAGAVGPVTIKSGWSPDDPKSAIAQMYGSIVKFSPKGGSFNFAYYKNTFAEPTLDPSLKTIDAASWICQIHNHFSPNKVIGAEWMRTGISQINVHNCNCENTRFDVDPFGRVWYPDLGRYRVGVLDTNGNLITTFGTYGNAESRGPDTAFAWLIGVGATDRYAYMGDSLNRRLIRARLTYASEARCDVPQPN